MPAEPPRFPFGGARARPMIERFRQVWRKGLGVPAILVLCASVWVFVELADDAPEGDYLAWETALLRALRRADDPSQGIGPWWLPAVMRDVTALGSAAVLTLAVLLVLGFLVLRGAYRRAVLLFLAIAGGYGMSEGLKRAFGRARPEEALRLAAGPHLLSETSASFPSGHSMVASAVYLTMAALLWHAVPRRRERAYLVCAAALLSILIGATRVYLGVHYPTDVVAGWAAGTAWAVLCWTVADWLRRRGAIAGASGAGEEPGAPPARRARDGDPEAAGPREHAPRQTVFEQTSPSPPRSMPRGESRQR
jgi:undecaprenyl-diphosphatase